MKNGPSTAAPCLTFDDTATIAGDLDGAVNDLVALVE